MKKIFIDCRTLEFNMRGIGFFSKSIIDVLGKIDEANEYYLFVNRQSNIQEKIILNNNFQFVEFNSPIGFSDLFVIPFIVNFLIKPDVVWFPANNCSPFISKRIKVISTLQDIMFFTATYKLFTKQWFGSLYRKSFSKIAINRANLINTTTKYNIELISNFFNVSSERFFYTYISNPIVAFSLESQYKQKIGITKKYLYTISGTSPNKNLEKLLSAFDLFNENNEYQLIITGTKYYEKKSDNIIFTGYIDNNMKHTLLKNCTMFLFLSRDEGFGIPPLEASYHNCNILVTKIPVFSELYSEIANFTDKDDINKISQDMKYSLENSVIYDYNDVMNRFNWEKSAKVFLGIFSA